MDRLKVLTLHRPLAIFPAKLWNILCREAKVSELSEAQLRKLYLRYCIFSGWNRGGTDVRRFISHDCGLNLLGLEELALHLFATFELVEVREVQFAARTAKNQSPASRQLEGILVVSDMGPKEPFMIFAGFPQSGPVADAVRRLRQGDSVVIQHYGVFEGVRQDVLFVDVASNRHAALLARQNARSALAFEEARERATDAVQKAQETVQQRIYCVSFIKFARTLLQFVTNTRDGLASVAVMALHRTGNNDGLLHILHGGCSKGAELALLEAWMKDRLESSEPSALVNFLLRYPIFLVPLLLVQKTLYKYTFGRVQEQDPLHPTTLHDAWTQSARQLVMDVLCELGIRKTPISSDDPYITFRAKEAMRSTTTQTRKEEDHNARLQRKRSSRLLHLGLGMNVKSDPCPGCTVVAPAQAAGVCHACEIAVKQRLADRGGYQYSRGVIDRASGIPLHAKHVPTPAIYIEEFDEQADRTFFFDVSMGESRWDLPSDRAGSARVHRLSKRDLKLLKNRRMPEWKRSLVKHEAEDDDYNDDGDM
ncbi:Hypothetical Protein FCC1311_048672 [Hondaea fermentalgiana]|uniref:Uncharacterized protein n=1 Tax=Hondaea fermentalgiana TaxID=2315210 RepID=A0A2R5GCD5_9STRA|nr:Hypothetical Protein FCC1311_048672 [Hondaea fermentalgiana]|eukprot:GBG28646.1 Hypothetical Protein FCC1311_048672 [Hondaea fermentalgiana]